MTCAHLVCQSQDRSLRRLSSGRIVANRPNRSNSGLDPGPHRQATLDQILCAKGMAKLEIAGHRDCIPYCLRPDRYGLCYADRPLEAWFGVFPYSNACHGFDIHASK
jgi:hypothetical protein